MCLDHWSILPKQENFECGMWRKCSKSWTHHAAFYERRKYFYVSYSTYLRAILTSNTWKLQALIWNQPYTLLLKTGRNIADKKRSSSEILRDIYGTKFKNDYDFGLVEFLDPDDFALKLEFLNTRWSLCHGFFCWFDCNRKKLFIDSVIQHRDSSRKTSLQHCTIHIKISKEKAMMK